MYSFNMGAGGPGTQDYFDELGVAPDHFDLSKSASDDIQRELRKIRLQARQVIRKAKLEKVHLGFRNDQEM